MNGIEQDVPRRKRRFSEEFKRDAVRLVVDEGYTIKAAASAVGVGNQSLRAWHAKYAPPSRAARMPRWRSCGKRISGCESNCDGPSWNAKSYKKRRRISRRSRCEVRLDP